MLKIRSLLLIALIVAAGSFSTNAVAYGVSYPVDMSEDLVVAEIMLGRSIPDHIIITPYIVRRVAELSNNRIQLVVSANYVGPLNDDAEQVVDLGQGVVTSAPSTAQRVPQTKAVSRSELTKLGSNEFYFDFDLSSLQATAKRALNKYVSYLKSHSAVSVVIEGHTDTVGTREYNLGLGQRRAEAVADYLVTRGVQRSRIRTTSFGEEKPALKGNSRFTNSKNRRVILNLQTSK